jgi:hypothetical protein
MAEMLIRLLMLTHGSWYGAESSVVSGAPLKQ